MIRRIYVVMATCLAVVLLAPIAQAQQQSDGSESSEPETSVVESADVTPYVNLTLIKAIEGDDQHFYEFIWDLTYPDGGLSFIQLFDGDQISESVPADSSVMFVEEISVYPLQEIVCEGATVSDLDAVNGTATINVGQVDATCTVLSAPPPPVNLTVELVASDSDGRTFDFAFDGGTVALGDGDSHVVSVPIGQGVHFFSPDALGWRIQEFVCASNEGSGWGHGGGSTYFDVQIGLDDVSCVITAMRTAQVEIAMTAVLASGSGNEFVQVGPVSLRDGETARIPANAGEFSSFYVPSSYLRLTDFTCNGGEYVINDPYVEVLVGETSIDCVASFARAEGTHARLGVVVDVSDVDSQDAFTIEVVDGNYVHRTVTVLPGETGEFWIPRDLSSSVTVSAAPGWSFGGVTCTGEDPANVSTSGSVQSFDFVQVSSDQVCTVAASEVDVVTVSLATGVNGTVSTEVNAGTNAELFFELPPGFVVDALVCEDSLSNDLFPNWSGWSRGQHSLFVDVGSLDVDCNLALGSAPTVEITITKQADGADPTLAFPLEIEDSTYALVDGESITFPWYPHTDLVIREPFLDGWRGERLSCIYDPEFPEEDVDAYDYGDDSGLVGREFYLWLVGDVDLNCTLVNEEPEDGGLVNVTITNTIDGDDPTDGATDFAFGGTFGSFTLMADESATFQLPENSWFVVYDLLYQRPGWAADAPTCTVNGQPIAPDQFDAFTEPWQAWFQVHRAEAGDDVACNFVNRAIVPATLTLTKELVGGANDEPFTVNMPWGSFDLAAGEPLEFHVAPGEHRLQEAPVAGWELTGLECTGATDFSLAGGGQMDIAVPEGGAVDCTLTNTSVGQVAVHVTKAVAGDADADAVFTLLAEPYIERRMANGDTISFSASAGTIVIAETMPLGWRLDQVVCTGQVTQTDYLGLGYVELTAAAGATVDCTFTNRHQPHATLQLTALIDGADPNPNGTVFEFRHGSDIATLGAGQVEEIPISASGAIAEDIRPGWEVTDLSCSPVDGVTIVTDGGSIEFSGVPQDGQLECTVTNSPIGLATLELTNTVDGDAGYFSGATSFSGPYGSFSIADGATTTLSVLPGTVSISHYVSDGWSRTVACEGKTVALFSSSFAVTLAPDETIACEVINSPHSTASLTIVNEVVGAGATPDLANFNFFASGQRVSLVNGESATIEVSPGRVVVSEYLQNNEGWTIEDVACVDELGAATGSSYFGYGNFSADAVLDLAGGDSVTCTFRNRYEEPERPERSADPGVTSIIKEVVNADGIDPAQELFSYQWFSGIDNGFFVMEPDGVERSLITSYGYNTMSIIEQPSPGWDLVSVTCTGTPSWHRNGTHVSIATGPGIDPVCTFVSEPVDLSTVTLVVETSGSSDQPTFTFDTATGPVDVAVGSPVTIDVGTTFWAEQQGLPGWNLASVVCNGADQANYLLGTDASLNRIEPGSAVTCTWRNTAAATAIVSVTQHVTGGDAGDDEFPLFTPAGEFVLSAGETVDVELAVGNTYVATAAKAGYQIENLTCDGVDWTRGGSGISLHLTPGDELACVFTSRVEAPAVVTIENTIEGFDNGQTFPFWTPVGEVLLRGGESVDVEVPAGALRVERRPLSGWEHLRQVCDRSIGVFVQRYFDGGYADLSLAPGETATCEFVSRLWFQPETGTVRIEKVVDGTDDGTSFLFVGPYGTNASLAGGESFEVEVEVGRPHDVTELSVAGWSLQSAECVGAESTSLDGSVLSVEVAADADVVCTFTNALDSPPPSFTDVPTGAYFEGAVGWAGLQGITTGTTPTTFSPNARLTRAQMATFLWRYAGEPVGAPAHGFADVPAGAYFDVAVAWLKQQGITTGTSDTTFSPNAPVTRAQMAAFLWRMQNEPVGAGHSFVDVPAGSYYDVAVGWMAGLGITTGTSDTTFSPRSRLTRAQAVTFLWRLDGQP